MLAAFLCFKFLILELVSLVIVEKRYSFLRRKNAVTEYALAILVSVVKNNKGTAVPAHTLLGCH